MSAKENPKSTKLTTQDPAAEHVGQEIESRFETHDVVATVFETRYSDDEHVNDSAKWGVVCQDCGRARDFHISVDDETGEYTISSVYIKSLEDRPCESYEVPDDVSTGDHTLVIDDECPDKIGRDRDVHCADCGRTSITPSDPEYAENYIARLGSFDCSDEFSTQELAGAVLYNSCPAYPDKDQVGIEHWNQRGGNGWGREINDYWWHSEVPVVLVDKSRRGQRWIEVQSCPGKNRSGSRHPCRRTPTIGRIEYKAEDSNEKDFDAVVDALTFMQQTNNLERKDFDRLAEVVESVFTHVVENHDVDAAV